MNVKERFMSDAEGLLGFVNLSRLHLFHSGSNDFFFYAQQTDIEIALANRLSLQKHTKAQIKPSLFSPPRAVEACKSEKHVRNT